MSLSDKERDAIVDESVLAAKAVLVRLREWLDGERVLYLGGTPVIWGPKSQPNATVINPGGTKED